MCAKASTCLYIEKEVVETAKQAGLNSSKVSENALVEAIGRLTGQKAVTGLKSRPPVNLEGRDRDLNPGARLHRPIGYQATSPRPLEYSLLETCLSVAIYVFPNLTYFQPKSPAPRRM